jgi:hypothetical protein
MRALSAELKKLLTRTNLVVFPEDYVIVYLPIGIHAIPGEWFRPATTRFAAVIQEPKLITMVACNQRIYGCHRVGPQGIQTQRTPDLFFQTRPHHRSEGGASAHGQGSAQFPRNLQEIKPGTAT